jgi:hypothetical protein
MKTKRITALIMALVLALSLTTTAFAVVYPANGNNTSWETAQELLMTTQTPAEFYVANNANQHVAVGTLSPGEEHWYRIFLTANSETVLGINTWRLSAEVFDSNLNLIFSEIFIKDPSKTGSIPQYVDIQSSGYYYVRLYGAITTDEYRLHMGVPIYSTGKYEYNGSTMSLTSTQSSVSTAINLTNVAAIPQDALVATITMAGTKAGTVTSEKRGMKHLTDSAFTIKTTPWQIDYSLTQNMTAKSSWTFQWSGSVKVGNTSTFVPKITFRYVYPVTPETY